MAKRISIQTIHKIKHLRKKGWSLPEIVAETKVGYGSAFRYIREVKIASPFRKLWFGKRGGSIKRKKLAEERAYIKAKEVINQLSDKERLIFSIALYWGEGNKKDFGLTNSDPNLIRVFVTALEKIFGISRERIRVSIRIFEDMDKDKCLKFWSEVVGIPAGNFVNVDVLKGKKKGKLLYGICKIRILKGCDMLKYVTALKKVISEVFLSPYSSTDRTGVS